MRPRLIAVDDAGCEFAEERDIEIASMRPRLIAVDDVVPAATPYMSAMLQ